MSVQKIIGLDGEKISSIDLESLEIIRFYPPFIVHDTLKKKEVEPDIKVYEEIDILKEIDFVLYAQPISKAESWAKRQKYVVLIRPEEAPVQKDFKILTKLPANHFIELDIANSKVRIIGPFVNKDQVGGWFNY